MLDPVTLSSGFSYEKEAIYKHFQFNGLTDPITREIINKDSIFENRNLKSAIEDFLSNNPWAFKLIPGQTSDKM